MRDETIEAVVDFMRNAKRNTQHVKIMSLLLVLTLLLAACNFSLPDYIEPVPVTPPPVTVAPPPPWQDARDLLEGVCFEYLVRQVNRQYVITTPFEHIDFYNEVDESMLCRFPVTRNPFDFDQGRILIGAMNIGTGCRATTDPLALVQDDETQTVTMRVLWGTEGDCGYELVRPFWVSIPRPPESYQVVFEFVPVE